MSSAKRHPQLPTIPTVAEQGFSDYEVTSWYALLAPAHTPKATITRLHLETTTILKSADARERLALIGAEPATSTPEELTNYIKSEMKRWAKLIAATGATAQ